MANIKIMHNGVEHELEYNPFRVIVPQAIKSSIVHQEKSSDGDAINFKESFDTRRGRLIWQKFTTYNQTFKSLLNYLRSIEGEFVQMSFGSAENEIGYTLDVYKTYTPVYISSVDVKIRDGGILRYDSVELVFENSESL